MITQDPSYAARLEIDYPDRALNRLTTAFRIVLVIPIVIVFGLISGATIPTYWDYDAGSAATASASIGGGLFLATVLMIVFRQSYPRWWFDFAREFERFTMRIGAYLALLSDVYPSTVDEQSVHLEIDYPDAKEDLNRWLPLIKWFLAIPHYFVVLFLAIAAAFCVIFAWFAILFTGRYPRGLFDFVVGVGRWNLRVQAYAFLLVTDSYPPFSLK